MSECELMELNRESFYTILKDFPELEIDVVRIALERDIRFKQAMNKIAALDELLHYEKFWKQTNFIEYIKIFKDGVNDIIKMNDIADRNESRDINTSEVKKRNTDMGLLNKSSFTLNLKKSLTKKKYDDDEKKNNENTESVLQDLQVSSNNIDYKNNQDIEKTQPVKFSRFKEDSNNNGFGYV